MLELVILNLPLLVPILLESKYNVPAEYPEPEETISADATPPPATTTLAVAPLQSVSAISLKSFTL